MPPPVDACVLASVPTGDESSANPTTAGRSLARRLLEDPDLCARVFLERDLVVRMLGVDMDDIREAGRHLDRARRSDARRARVALFHLAVACRSVGH